MRRFPPGSCLAVVPLAVLLACESPPEPLALDVDAHRREIEQFAFARQAELAAPDSWLSLIALRWISEGETTLGSDPSNDLVLPEGKADPFVGIVVLHDGAASFVSAEGARVTLGVDSTLSLEAGSGAFPPDLAGDPVVSEAEMGSAGPGKSKIFRNGSISWILLGRGERAALRVRDNDHEAYETFAGIDRYETRPEWRVTARWVPHEKTVAVPNVLGTVSEVTSPAHVAFWIDGEKHTLDVTDPAGDERFMLVFADSTTGRGTYGGGRYLWFAAPDADGRVVLDFNRAYNPPCVWTPFATCPLPSRDNRLTVAVEAGEKEWAHE